MVSTVDTVHSSRPLESFLFEFRCSSWTDALYLHDKVKFPLWARRGGGEPPGALRLKYHIQSQFAKTNLT